MFITTRCCARKGTITPILEMGPQRGRKNKATGSRSYHVSVRRATSVASLAFRLHHDSAGQANTRGRSNTAVFRPCLCIVIHLWAAPHAGKWLRNHLLSIITFPVVTLLIILSVSYSSGGCLFKPLLFEDKI